MLVFIDESGCPGMKLGEGSTPLFTVTLLGFKDPQTAIACDQRISQLKQELGWGAHREFHFNKLDHEHRCRFLETVRSYDFFYCATVLNKAKLTGEGFKFPDSFYKFTCKLVFQNAKEHLRDAIVVVDGSGSRRFRLELSTYLRQRTNDATKGICHIKKVKVQDSHANNLIQMADVICGAVARSFTDKAQRDVYRNLVKHREHVVHRWP